jgi:hypothetical protein
MLFFTNGTEREREGLALSLQSAGGALAGEARTARANRDLTTGGGESTRVPTRKQLGIEVLLA